MFSVVGEIRPKCQSRAALAHWVLIVFIHMICIWPSVWIATSMRRQEYKPNEVVAGREGLDEVLLWGQHVCETSQNSVSAAFPALTRINNLQEHFSRAPLSILKRFKKWQLWIIVWIHWERSAKLVMLWPAHCTFKCLVKFPPHRRLFLDRIVLHTVEVRSWSGCCVSGIWMWWFPPKNS